MGNGVHKLGERFEIDRENSRLILNEDTRSSYSYAVYKDHVELLKYQGDEKEVLVPETLMGRPVTVIGVRCFADKEIVSVHLSEKYAEENDIPYEIVKEW